MTRKEFSAFVIQLQKNIVASLEDFDGKKFLTDEWQREEGGYGISCVLQDGNVFEKAGVNVSVVHGPLSEQMIRHMASRGKHFTSSSSFSASGISIVIHPKNPFAPTVHMNYRYFEVLDQDTIVDWWFGGGSDLTPSYLFEEDCRHFHGIYKSICDKYDSKYHPKFKKWCDEYFYICHRQESRGIGGIFFDDLNEKPFSVLFEMITEMGTAFISSYIPIVEKRYQLKFTEDQRKWQLLRRGRYVEFNLVYDRGTKFGLVSGGRIESILMSLPETARWEYNHVPIKGSPEEALISVLKAPINWI